MQAEIGGKFLLSIFLAFVVGLGLVPQAAAVETEEDKTITIAREYLDEDGLHWDRAVVDPVGDSKAWVTVAPDQERFNGGGQFYRVAVDTDEGVATVQEYQISAPDEETGIAHARLYADGELFWSGTVSEQGEVVADEDSPEIDTTRSRGVCEWAMGALCGTGGGAACYGACAALGLVSGPGGLGCAAVCALISSLGCTAATKKVCG